MDKISLIKSAIEKADKFQSKLTPEAMGVPFLGSLKIRALLNNLGELATHFGEAGCHKSGSFCSTIFGNSNIKSATAIDSWESDATSEDKAYPQFMANTLKFKPENTELNVIVSDCWKVDLGSIPNKIDLYSYDCGHSEDDQCKALTYYYPVLADEFIFCCDDFGWPEVKAGTKRGIKEARLEVLFEQEFITDHEYDNMSWWTGYYIALLKKKV
jgi:hypothetical protein